VVTRATTVVVEVHPTLAGLTTELEHYFRVNAMGPLRVTKALLPCLRAGGARRVVQVTSKMGSVADNQGGGSYGYRASKAALKRSIRSKYDSKVQRKLILPMS